MDIAEGLRPGMAEVGDELDGMIDTASDVGGGIIGSGLSTCIADALAASSASLRRCSSRFSSLSRIAIARSWISMSWHSPIMDNKSNQMRFHRVAELVVLLHLAPERRR